MNKPIFYSCVVLACVLLLTGCKPEFDQIEVHPYPVDDSQAQVLRGLADIESTITTEWATATTGLQTAVTTLAQTPNAVTLAVARQAWRNARDPWERNESFGFGPVATEGIDGSSDDWPLDQLTLTQLISTTAIVLDASYVPQMPTSTKGFHAIEFLLFGETGNKTTDQFSAREWQLLTLLTADLTKQATELKTRWTSGTTNSFYDNYVAAGQTGSTYTKTTDALGEVLGSMVDIMTELPDSKINLPLINQSSRYAESRFSDYSLMDYRNNIYGVYTAYTGQYGSATATKSISDLVVAARPTVDDQIRTQFKLCLALIDLIPPTTFNQAITAKPDQLRDLQGELRKLNQMLNGSVKPLLGLD